MIGVGVKNICYSWREPEFGSHNLHSGSQPFATPILGYPTPFSDLYRCQAHMWYTYIHAGKILIYRNKVSKSQKKNNNNKTIITQKLETEKSHLVRMCPWESGLKVQWATRTVCIWIEVAVGIRTLCISIEGTMGNQDRVHLD